MYCLFNQRLIGLFEFQLLLPLVSSYRYGGDDVNLTLAKSEAKILHQKISEKEYACDDVIRILTTRSKAQINATLNHYKNEFGNDINKVYQLNYDIFFTSISFFTPPYAPLDNNDLISYIGEQMS